MADWRTFERQAPLLARFGLERLRRFGVGLGFLATVRAEDGGPRVHPVSPVLVRGKLYVMIEHTSPKLADLRSNPRYMLHAFPDEGDPEFSVRGSVREVTGAMEHGDVLAAIDFAAHNPGDPLFELFIDRADSTLWEGWGTPDQRPVRRRWLAPPE